jgi:signal recognition particle subunit SRP54
MVLAELGLKIKEALVKLNGADVIDKKLLDEVLNALGIALIKSDVKIKIVARLQQNIRNQFTNIEEESGNKRLMVQRAVVKELQQMLTTEKKPYVMKKGKPNIVMFVGLQGSGKTTTCTKYAYHYLKKGWKVALVCADTFRAGAFDQLKQNATKCRIPFYGSYTEMDPVKIAEEGVTHFKKQNYELIIVDTSGRHKQEEALFDEMKQVASVTAPDDIIFVMDSHIGQACHDQALAFKKAVDIGSVIITKLDGHAKGGGALSAVAATESPIIFIGTGEHFEDFEPFNPESFIKRLLGMGDIPGLFAKVKEVITPENQAKLAENLQKGDCTLRNMRDQYQSVLKMGPLDKVVSMIPGLSNAMIPQGKEKEAGAKIKKYLCMMDSMTDDELDKKKKIDEGRMRRIARGCGCIPQEVADMMEEYNKFAKMVEKMGKMMKGKGDISQMSRNPGQIASQLGSIVPQNILNQLGGTGNLMNMMKEMGQLEGMGQMGAGGGAKKKRGNR